MEVFKADEEEACDKRRPYLRLPLCECMPQFDDGPIVLTQCVLVVFLICTRSRHDHTECFAARFMNAFGQGTKGNDSMCNCWLRMTLLEGDAFPEVCRIVACQIRCGSVAEELIVAAFLLIFRQ